MRTASLQRGFTLVEIMVVVVIIGVLATFVLPQIVGQDDEARIKKAQSDLRALESALDIYRLDNHNYPSSDQGLQSLIEKPSGSPEPKNWQEAGYIKRLSKDPWGNEYQYIYPGSEGVVDIYSLGPDGVESDDDIGNWSLQ